MDIISKFRKIETSINEQIWHLVGDYTLGPKIPFFGQTLEYTLRTGNGEEPYYSLLRHFGWVVVFGVTVDQQVVTLVQWKPGVNQASWELPPGGIGKVAPGTSIADITATTREIYMKETGYNGGDWEYLGYGLVETGKYRGAGPNDHGLRAHYYLASGLVKGANARHPNRNEIMETLLVPLSEWREVEESGLFTEISAQKCSVSALIRLGLLKWS